MRTPVSTVRGLPLVGALPHLALDPIRFLERSVGERPYVRVRLGPYRALIVNDAEGVQEVLVDRQQDFTALTPVRKRMKRIFGNGLLTNDGESWLQQRRLIQPAFHRRHLANWAGIMTQQAEVTLAKWRSRGRHQADMAVEMMDLAQRVVTQALFGIDVSATVPKLNRTMELLLEAIWRTRRFPLPIPAAVPTRANRLFSESVRELDRLIYGFIAERRTRRGGDDLMSLLLEAQDADTGERMTDRQLRDEIVTFFLAGHETTAAALTWMWLLLEENPAVAGRLRRELSGMGHRPAFDDLARLPYLEQVVKEALRLYPPSWSMARMATRNSSVGGHKVPEGSLVLMFPYLMHRSSRYWRDPLCFDPSRFASGRESERQRFAYFPFGGGPRQCPGNLFALYEVQLVFATLFPHVTATRTSYDKLTLWPSVTLRPKHGLPMTISADSHVAA